MRRHFFFEFFIFFFRSTSIPLDVSKMKRKTYAYQDFPSLQSHSNTFISLMYSFFACSMSIGQTDNETKLRKILWDRVWDLFWSLPKLVLYQVFEIFQFLLFLLILLFKINGVVFLSIIVISFDHLENTK